MGLWGSTSGHRPVRQVGFFAPLQADAEHVIGTNALVDADAIQI
jgi:hypothetical protein